jgi:hypothetical protein
LPDVEDGDGETSPKVLAASTASMALGLDLQIRLVPPHLAQEVVVVEVTEEGASVIPAVRITLGRRGARPCR